MYNQFYYYYNSISHYEALLLWLILQYLQCPCLSCGNDEESQKKKKKKEKENQNQEKAEGILGFLQWPLWSTVLHRSQFTNN